METTGGPCFQLAQPDFFLESWTIVTRFRPPYSHTTHLKSWSRSGRRRAPLRECSGNRSHVERLVIYGVVDYGRGSAPSR